MITCNMHLRRESQYTNKRGERVCVEGGGISEHIVLELGGLEPRPSCAGASNGTICSNGRTWKLVHAYSQ